MAAGDAASPAVSTGVGSLLWAADADVRGRAHALPRARLAATVGGTLIGRGADLIVIDDPIAPAHVYDATKRNAVKKWFDAEVIQRLNDKKTGAVIVVMQRLAAARR